MVSAQSSTPAPDIPPGFYLIDEAEGVQLFKKDYPNGNPDYVQVVRLDEGAHLKLLHGEITEPRPEKGDYGGPDPRMTSIPIETYWQQLRLKENKAFCITNGLFFYMPEYPTRLAFPLRVDGKIVTDGWGMGTYVGEQLMLELWEDRADIIKLSEANLAASTAPNLIGGLTEEANKRAKFSVGRTFVGVDDQDGDGSAETVLVFNTLSARQTGAADTLRSFGADEVMMLDGGGSTQLLCASGWHIRSDRPLPQAIAIIAAPKPAVSSRVTNLTDWQVISDGERLPLQVEIQNTGIVTWTPESTSFIIQTDRLELAERLPVPQATAPGEKAVLDHALILGEKSGVTPLTITYEIEYKGKIYRQPALEIHAIVLPQTLADRKFELISELKTWETEQPNEIDGLAEKWIETQMNKPDVRLEIEGVNTIRPVDATLVPLLMLPLMALIAWAIARTRQ